MNANTNFESLSLSIDSDSATRENNKKESCATFQGTRRNAERTFENLSNLKGYRIGQENGISEKTGYERKGNNLIIFSFDEKTKSLLKGKKITISKGTEIFLKNETFILDETLSVRILKERTGDKETGIVPVKGSTEKHKFLFVNPSRFPNGLKIKITE